MGKSRRRLFVLPAALAFVAAMVPAPVAAATVTPVVTGLLWSPRGIAFRDGTMLVAEAGIGPNTNHVDGQNCWFTAPVSQGGAGDVCIGNTGRISSIKNGTRTTLVGGLFSETARGGFDAEGPAGLAVDEEGRILAQISTPPQEVPVPPTINKATSKFGVKQAGRLIMVRSKGRWSTVAKVGEFDYNFTTTVKPPQIQEIDANPYGLLVTEDGTFVTDAGSNTLDKIDEDGKPSIVIYDGFRTGQVFPTDAVPTCVVQTEDGFLVGELSGRVLKVRGDDFTVINDDLFTHITGCTSDGDGNVYFVNMFGPGEFLSPSWQQGNVVKYDTESGQATMLASPLFFPNMDAIGPDGNLYVSVGSNCPTSPLCGGQSGGVVKINLPHNEEND